MRQDSHRKQTLYRKSEPPVIDFQTRIDPSIFQTENKTFQIMILRALFNSILKIRI